MIDNVINIVMSPGVYLFYRSKNRFWSVNYTPDDVITHLLLTKTVTGISFKLIRLVELKLFNFVISANLVCKIHKKQVTEKMTLFLSINY